MHVSHVEEQQCYTIYEYLTCTQKQLAREIESCKRRTICTRLAKRIGG